MGTYDDFWAKASPAIPGMLDLGIGAYTRNQAGNDAAKRLANAQGPLYQQAMGGASGMLTQLGNMNPDALAASRFGAKEALLAPVQDKQLTDLMSMLRAKGMLGISNYNPGVAGVTPNGTPMNPQLAAFFAAQNADRAQRATSALTEGQTYADNLAQRSRMLSGQAGNVQQTGLQAQGTQPSRAAGTAELLKGTMGVLKDTGALKTGIGMLGNGLGWLGKKVSDWWNPTPQMIGDFNPSGGFDPTSFESAYV